MKADLNELMKKAAEMQEKMQQAQQELANKEVRGEAGAGLVSLSCSTWTILSPSCGSSRVSIS